MSTATIEKTGSMPDWLGHVDRAEGWLSLDEARLLHTLAGEVAEGCIVEVGAYRGRSTIALSAGAPEGIPVYSIDPHAEMWVNGKLAYAGPDDRAAFYRAMLDSGATRNVHLLNSTSERLTPGWDIPVGLLWIDGDHSYEGVARDWACWRPHLMPGCTVVFDDAHDPAVGPHRLISELLAAGEIVHRRNVGKVRSVVFQPAG
ncbi:MAG: class I SAM-dependent methyltransferase [Planctomycetota bacterium]|nr:MAG: class I SAM-dependent methyltransferase [Planctomycetota bacterium]